MPSNRTNLILKGLQNATADVVLDAVKERNRQIAEEGFTPTHDDQFNVDGQLAKAGAAYALEASGDDFGADEAWPWDRKWWKPTDRRRNLIKAIALLIAAVEQIDRKENQK